MAETLTRSKRDTAQLLAAVDTVADVFTAGTCDAIGKKITCNEADAFEWLLRAAGKNRKADFLMRAHAMVDDPADSHYPHADGEHTQYTIPSGGTDD